MSRIGGKPVIIPEGVKVELGEKNKVKISGKMGVLEKRIHPSIKVKVEDNKIILNRDSDSKFHKSLHGLSRSLLNGMVIGVSKGFEKVLEIEGVGYRANVEGEKLIVQVGYSHPIKIDPPKNITFEVEKQKLIKVKGIDKQEVGEIAAQIRKLRKPEPYKGKGIRYQNELIKKKVGKSGVK
ncbi:MAG: 50S ribosomal protein L6 [Candidatus Caldatribacteriota bacterium]